MIAGLAFITAVAMLLNIRSFKPSVVVFWIMYAVVAGVFTYAIGI